MKKCKGMYTSSDGGNFTFISTSHSEGVEVILKYEGELWASAVRGQSAGILISTGDRVILDINGRVSTLDYDQAERLYLLLREERVARKGFGFVSNKLTRYKR